MAQEDKSFMGMPVRHHKLAAASWPVSTAPSSEPSARNHLNAIDRAFPSEAMTLPDGPAVAGDALVAWQLSRRSHFNCLSMC
jgi:hypothetical protein